MSETAKRERFPVVVVGAGQAGLAVGYYLKRQGIDHVILDGATRVGDTWRARWDSLRLFTPARYDGLPGLPFPAAAGSFPTKDEMADYLEDYVGRHSLPVRLGARIDRLSREGDGYVVDSAGLAIEADHVVVATGAHQTRSIPRWAPTLDSSIQQLHAADYRNPSQVGEGPVLVVGAGNSGAEIAMELTRAGHPTSLAGKSTGHIPAAAYAFNGVFFWFLANKILSVDTPMGRRAQPRVRSHGGPLIRLTMKDVTDAGVVLVPRAGTAQDGRPVLEDGRSVEVASVIWCTGFGHDFSWIDLPGVAPDGLPEHDRGVVASQPGLYFIGLPFLTKLASAFVGGVGDDAKGVVRTIAGRLEAKAAGGLTTGHVDRPVEMTRSEATRA